MILPWEYEIAQKRERGSLTSSCLVCFATHKHTGILYWILYETNNIGDITTTTTTKHNNINTISIIIIVCLLTLNNGNNNNDNTDTDNGDNSFNFHVFNTFYYKTPLNLHSLNKETDLLITTELK